MTKKSKKIETCFAVNRNSGKGGLSEDCIFYYDTASLEMAFDSGTIEAGDTIMEVQVVKKYVVEPKFGMEAY